MQRYRVLLEYFSVLFRILMITPKLCAVRNYVMQYKRLSMVWCYVNRPGQTYGACSDLQLDALLMRCSWFCAGTNTSCLEQIRLSVWVWRQNDLSVSTQHACLPFSHCRFLAFFKKEQSMSWQKQRKLAINKTHSPVIDNSQDRSSNGNWIDCLVSLYLNIITFLLSSFLDWATEPLLLKSTEISSQHYYDSQNRLFLG